MILFDARRLRLAKQPCGVHEVEQNDDRQEHGDDESRAPCGLASDEVAQWDERPGKHDAQAREPGELSPLIPRSLGPFVHIRARVARIERAAAFGATVFREVLE